MGLSIIRIRSRTFTVIPNGGTTRTSHPAWIPPSNNEAENETILFELDLALALSISKLRIYSNSQLVVRHVQEEYMAKDERMARYLTKGMDIVGPLQVAAAQKKFLLVATDYFSKWVEAEAYANIKDKDVTKFVWKKHHLPLWDPSSNHSRQWPTVEVTNKTLVTALKKRLEQAKGKWVEELSGVLWAYRTTPGRPTGNTPFALAYGMDAIIPKKTGLPTIRIDARGQGDGSIKLGRNLDWADEVRESASIGWPTISKEWLFTITARHNPGSSSNSRRNTSRLPIAGIPSPSPSSERRTRLPSPSFEPPNSPANSLSPSSRLQG
ncbi:hypothetical protein CK203_115052 [Vitis vinifera]|uniref:RNase H type-1 domain-containing protein n=1 Tax=Vitis vinifera TaxID=29760 RepID=A0A438CC53_VITVI|nr:hypothetical protein CK203_115052 [Vitis vinifera]